MRSRIIAIGFGITTASNALQAQWTIIDLSTNHISTANDVNGLSTVGQLLDSNQAFQWQGSTLTIPPIAGNTFAAAQGINQAGHVAGSSGVNGDSATHACAWMASSAYGWSAGVHDLGTLGGQNSVALDVSNSFTAVGWSNDDWDVRKPCIWWRWGIGTQWFTARRQLELAVSPHVNAVRGTAFAINNSNTPRIVGEVTLSNNQSRAVRWELQAGVGHVTAATRLLSTAESRAHDVNDSGFAVGFAKNAAGHSRPVRWGNNSLGFIAQQDLGTLGGTSGGANGINNAGQVVGWSYNTNGSLRAFLWDLNGGMRDLNSLLPQSSGWVLHYGNEISEVGAIVGQGTRDGVVRAFLMFPDADGDFVADAYDNCPNSPNHSQLDWDHDGVGNPCDNCETTANADQVDADFDGVGDTCDNCQNAYNPDQEDADDDGIGNACETEFELGDVNCDGVISVGDISGFVEALTDPAGYPVQYPNCDIDNADMNQNGAVNVGDIGLFVLALTGG